MRKRSYDAMIGFQKDISDITSDVLKRLIASDQLIARRILEGCI